jgi:hypothetical protein
MVYVIDSSPNFRMILSVGSRHTSMMTGEKIFFPGFQPEQSKQFWRIFYDLPLSAQCNIDPSWVPSSACAAHPSGNSRRHWATHTGLLPKDTSRL